MAAQKKRDRINLLPKSEFEMSFGGQFLKWSLTAGRYLVILTELVVIVAFLSRFKLDKDLSDLADSITAKKRVLEASSEYEKEFRSLQSRLGAIETLVASQPQLELAVDAVVRKVPVGVKLTNLSAETGGLTIIGTAGSGGEFGEFMNLMSTDKSLKSLELTDISNDGKLGIKFGLKAKWNKDGATGL